jgi:hypothetical protein
MIKQTSGRMVRASAVPPKQSNYATALELAWDRIAERPPEALLALGAEGEGPRQFRLRVLNGTFHLDISRRRMNVSGNTDISQIWQILVLHYLLASAPVPAPKRQITFEEMPEARGYSGPYRGRVLGLFCATVGRDEQELRDAALRLECEVVTGGNLTVQVQVFPLISLAIVWYPGDEELPPGASFLYEDNIASLLETEDIIVMSERVLSRMRGRPW